MQLRQRRVQPRQRLRAIRAPHNELAHHAVIKRRNTVALHHAGVDARQLRMQVRKAHMRRCGVRMQGAGGRQKVVVWIFSANAGFNCVTVNDKLCLQ